MIECVSCLVLVVAVDIVSVMVRLYSRFVGVLHLLVDLLVLVVEPKAGLRVVLVLVGSLVGVGHSVGYFVLALLVAVFVVGLLGLAGLERLVVRLESKAMLLVVLELVLQNILLILELVLVDPVLLIVKVLVVVKVVAWVLVEPLVGLVELLGVQVVMEVVLLPVVVGVPLES
jgi:hypothetical protein